MANHASDYSREAASARMRSAGYDDRITDAGGKVQELASDVAEHARRYGDKAQEAARQFKPFVARSLKEQPLATLAGAAAIGFILGALWRR